jgi:hypothetical protein
MFSTTRVLKVAYLLVLGSAVVLLSFSSQVRGQRAMMAPMAPRMMPTPPVGGFMQSYMMANMMLMQAGRGGMMMGGMMGMMGMRGMGGGMMGMMGMGGMMMGGMMGMGMRGGMMGMGGGMMGMGGGMMGMGGMSMMGMGGMMMGGMSMMGFAGKGMGGFNGKKAL